MIRVQRYKGRMQSFCATKNIFKISFKNASISHFFSNLHSKTTERKFVIGKNKKEFAIIEKYGMVNLSEVQWIWSKSIYVRVNKGRIFPAFYY